MLAFSVASLAPAWNFTRSRLTSSAKAVVDRMAKSAMIVAKAVFMPGLLGVLSG